MKKKIVLIASLVAGLAAACFTRLYLAAKDAEIQEIRETYRSRFGEMWVLCYAKDTPSGTVLSRADFQLKKVPEVGMRGQALTEEDVADVVGRKTIIMHNKHDVVFWSDIEGGDPTAKGLSADIKRSMRAVSINCSGSAAVSSMVKPNDHVDVIGTFDFEGGNGQKNLVTCTILQRVLVLATGNTTAKNARQNLGLNNAYNTVTLEVTPREAEMLAFAEQIKGRLVLTLRNRNDTSYEAELPQVDFEKIRSEIESLNLQRQQQRLTTHH